MIKWNSSLHAMDENGDLLGGLPKSAVMNQALIVKMRASRGMHKNLGTRILSERWKYTVCSALREGDGLAISKFQSKKKSEENSSAQFWSCGYQISHFLATDFMYRKILCEFKSVLLCVCNVGWLQSGEKLRRVANCRKSRKIEALWHEKYTSRHRFCYILFLFLFYLEVHF